MTESARIAAIQAGERRVIARAITQIENRSAGYAVLEDALYPATGNAWRVGITGPPGAGKSTLVNQLIGTYRTAGEQVGVVAVDPSSPFTGGALLGDRVRMEARSLDAGVFIRSVASRGALGGLSRQTEAVADVLDAAGYGTLLIETVGVGQAELDIARAADTVVVVLVPESGDAVQAMKAGLMEIADIFCVNKSDHPEARALVHALRAMLHLRPHTAGDWQPRVVQTVATEAEGMQPLTEAMQAHRDHLQSANGWRIRRDDRLRRKVARLVQDAWEAGFWTPERRRVLDDALHTLNAERRTPHALAEQLLEDGQG